MGAPWSSRTEKRLPGLASLAGMVALAAALACPADPPVGGAALLAAMFFAQLVGAIAPTRGLRD